MNLQVVEPRPELKAAKPPLGLLKPQRNPSSNPERSHERTGFRVSGPSPSKEKNATRPSNRLGRLEAPRMLASTNGGAEAHDCALDLSKESGVEGFGVLCFWDSFSGSRFEVS